MVSGKAKQVQTTRLNQCNVPFQRISVKIVILITNLGDDPHERAVSARGCEDQMAAAFVDDDVGTGVRMLAF